MREDGVAGQKSGNSRPVGPGERREAERGAKWGDRQQYANGSDGERRRGQGGAGAALDERDTRSTNHVDDQRLGEQGTTQMEVAISTEGSVTDCKVTKSSGSERLDTAACTYVQGHWRWKPPTREGKPVAVNTAVSVVWNLKDAQ